MNLVGKIFTVLIFLMCVVFGTLALMLHAAHTNWRTQTQVLSTELTKANSERTALAAEKTNLANALEDEKLRARRRLIALEEEKKSILDDRNRKEEALKTMESDNRKLAASIGESTKRIGVMETEIEGMRNNIKVAQDERGLMQKKLIDTTDDLMNAVAERQRLEKLQRELADQITKLRDLQQYGKVDPKADAPRGLEGEVLSVPRPETVEISVGADDGVRKGHQFVVTRPSAGGKYVGVIVVTSVDFPNRAVCRPDKSRQTDQIYKGDHVKAISSSR